MFIWDLAFSWDRPVRLNFLFMTSFAISAKFWYVIIHSHLSLDVFWSHFLFLLWISHFFSSMLFNLKYLWCFLLSFCSWFFISKHCGQRINMLGMISIFLSLLKLVLCLNVWSILENIQYVCIFFHTILSFIGLFHLQTPHSKWESVLI